MWATFMTTINRFIMSTFGQNVRKLRQKRGYSQETLSELAGLHVTFVGGIERGIRNPSLVNIVKLSKALKVKPAELFKGIKI